MRQEQCASPDLTVKEQDENVRAIVDMACKDLSPDAVARLRAQMEKHYWRLAELEAALESISNGEGAGGLAETERLQEIARAALGRSGEPQ